MSDLRTDTAAMFDPAARPGRGTYAAATVLFGILFGIYQIDWIPGLVSPEEACARRYFPRSEFPIGMIDAYTTDDSTPNLFLAANLLDHGVFSFTAAQCAEMLRWKYHPPGQDTASRQVTILAVDETIAALQRAGQLQIVRGYYMVVPSATPDRFANTFGGGAGVTSIPLMAALRAVGAHDLEDPIFLQRVGRWTASGCVAGSAVFLFLTAASHLSLGWSLLLALSYGLGTSVYPISSQSLWQHGPTELFLTMGVFFLSRTSATATSAAALAGAALAWSTWCRPTSVLTFACVAAYLLVVKRRSLVPYLATGVPIGLALMLFNTLQFGGPLKFGQTELAVHAEETTGSPEIWQTPIGYGAIASLFSPSRGLFVYSPFLIFSIAGATLIWRDPRWSFLRPLPFAILAVWAIEFRHFDWWGGWSFGYRHIVDTVPLLMFLLIPVLTKLATRRWLSVSFGLLVVLSIGVQLVGTFLYDRWGWNCRPGYLVKLPQEAAPRRTFDRSEAERWAADGGALTQDYFNIDRPPYRDRLWSIGDSQLVYYVTHPFEAYFSKQKQVERSLRSRTTRLAETYDRLGEAACALDSVETAKNFFGKALALDPRLLVAYFHYRALQPQAPLPDTSASTSENADETTTLDLRLRQVLDLVAQDKLDQAIALVDRTGHEHSDEAQRCLQEALARFRDGLFFTEISAPLQPTFQRLCALCERFNTK